jgi:signal transduction histidine kinase
MSRRGGALRLRLLLGAAVWIAIALLIAGLILARLFAIHVHDRFASELGHHLDQLAAGLEIDAAGNPMVVDALSDPRFERPLSGLYWQVATERQTVLRSRSLWDQSLILPEAGDDDGRVSEFWIEGPNQRPLFVLERSLLLPDSPDSLRIAVAEDLSDLIAARDSFNRTLVLSLLTLAAALIAAAVIQVSLGLRPLRWLRDELLDIRSGRTRRFARPMPTEVQPLVDDLNALLDHAEEVVERGRLQAGNLAHGLKTHLAVLANEAERLAGPHLPAEGAETAELIRARVAEMRRQLDHHMARARAAATRGLPGASVDVAVCTEALVRVMRKVHADRDLTLRSEIDSGLSFSGDRQDLDEILGNLIDNACKWANRGIWITASREGETLLITVDDDGLGLTPSQRIAALTPGVRLDETTPGSGLGLAVVHDLVHLYAGAFELAQSPRGGLRASLRLPAAS